MSRNGRYQTLYSLAFNYLKNLWKSNKMDSQLYILKLNKNVYLIVKISNKTAAFI